MQVLELFLLAVVFLLGIVGMYYWFMAYLNCNKNSKGMMVFPIWIFMNDIFNEEGNRYRTKFIRISIAAAVGVLLFVLMKN